MVIPRWRVGFPRVTHPFATRVERNKFPSRRVRLACIRHAASVHPEPGSNSHERSWVSIDSKIFLLAFVFLIGCLQLRFEFIVVPTCVGPFHIWCVCLCSVFNELLSPPRSNFYMITRLIWEVNTFFKLFYYYFSSFVSNEEDMNYIIIFEVIRQLFFTRI